MKPELRILKSVAKDSVNQDVYSVFSTLSSRNYHGGCDYRYDEKEKAIYTDREYGRPRYTYIAKAKDLDVYKIGHTTNLSKRFISLHSKPPYSLLELEPFAYTPEDVESEILAIYGSTFRELPEPFNTAKELVFLDKSGIEWLLNAYPFTRVISGKILPGEMKKITRYYFEPTNGECIKTRVISSFDNTGEQIISTYNHGQ